MATTYYKVRVNINSIDPDLAKAYRDANQAVTNALAALSDAYKKSPRYQALVDLAAPGSMGSKPNLFCKVEGGDLVFDVPMQNQSVANQTYLSLGEKTINTLINGKLLSDAEKRKLIERVTQGAIPAGDGQAS